MPAGIDRALHDRALQFIVIIEKYSITIIMDLSLGPISLEDR